MATWLLSSWRVMGFPMRVTCALRVHDCLPYTTALKSRAKGLVGAVCGGGPCLRHRLKSGAVDQGTW